MTDDKAYHIVTVGGGKCLDNTQSAHGVLDCIPKGSDSQKWTIETDPNDSNVVAFKSIVDGQYLRNTQPAHIYKARIGVGEKDWWTLEKGKNPGSCLIRSNACTAGASYLNDFEGKYQDRNYVHMWGMDQNRQFWLDWYILPADAGFNPKEAASSTASEEPTSNDFQQKTEELDAREAALTEREQDLAQREAALKQQQQQADSNAAVEDRATNKVEQSQPAPQSDKADDSSQSSDQLALLRAENENLKLKLKIQDLEEQLKNARKPQTNRTAGKGARTSTPSQVSTNGRGKKDPVVYDCGHVAYPPPRKIRYHVVGMLYEGLDEPFELSERQKATLARHEHHS